MAARRPRPIGIAVITLVAIVVTVLAITIRHAHGLVSHPVHTRPLPSRTPGDSGLLYQSVFVTARDGLKLVGWFVPAAGGALVMAQHGYKGHRGEMLEEAAMLHRRGYGVLITSVRAHDRSEGERISFGVEEVHDLAAWHDLARTLPGVDPARIGLLGNSWGGTLAIQYAAAAPGIRAVVAHSAFSSIDDTVDTSVRFFTGLPAFPFAPLILFWAERQGGFESSVIDAKRWIARLSPRPVLLLQGGADAVISPDSGQRLFDAAGEPRELWFEPTFGHAAFDRQAPREYENRVVGFFDRHLGPE